MNLNAVKVYLLDEYRELARTLTGTPQKASEDQLIERATRGSEARHFLESRLVQEFMASAEAKLVEQLVTQPLGDDDGRKRLAVAVQTQRQLWKWLATVATDGVQAERELERLRTGKRAFF